MILRITHFRWGDSCHNWYPDQQSAQRQLHTEMERTPSPDVTGEEWFDTKPITKPAPSDPLPAGPKDKLAHIRAVVENIRDNLRDPKPLTFEQLGYKITMIRNLCDGLLRFIEEE